MAASGLFMLPRKRNIPAAVIWDKVKCPYCKIVMGDWSPSDDPLAEHKRMSPRCKFVAPPERKRSKRKLTLRGLGKKSTKAAARRAAEAAISSELLPEMEGSSAPAAAKSPNAESETPETANDEKDHTANEDKESRGDGSSSDHDKAEESDDSNGEYVV
jgi:Inhibitor of Apoptosis domain